MDERKRDLALAQVAADRLANRLRIAGVIEQIVHELKRDAEVEAVVAQRLLALGRDLAKHAANLRAAAEEIRRLAAHDVEMFFFRDVGVAVLRQLIELPFDHLQRDVAQHADQIERIVRQRERHRFDVQIVAEKHGDVVAPPRVDRQPAAAQIGVVDDVVVDERRGVNEFDDRRVQDRPIAGVAAEARRHQQHRGTNALSAAGLDVPPDLRNQLDLRLDVPAEFTIDRLEVGANGLEDLRQRGRRVFHGSAGRTLSRPE